MYALYKLYVCMQNLLICHPSRCLSGLGTPHRLLFLLHEPMYVLVCVCALMCILCVYVPMYVLISVCVYGHLCAYYVHNMFVLCVYVQDLLLCHPSRRLSGLGNSFLFLLYVPIYVLVCLCACAFYVLIMCLVCAGSSTLPSLPTSFWTRRPPSRPQASAPRAGRASSVGY
jgi:hypothetical protein